VIDLTIEEWWEQQAPTFQAAIDAGVLGIMGTHRAFPAADDEMVNGRYIPCTCSKKVLTDILRNQMGFKGVMITDGINMTALAAQFPREEMLIRAIEAGNDMVCGAILEDFDTLYNAIEDGKLSMERVDEACERVLTLKEQVGLFDETRELPKMEDIVPKTKEVCKQIVDKSVTLVRDHNHIIPLNKEKIKKVLLIISTHAPQPEKLIEPMVRALEAQGFEVEVSVDLDSADRLKIYADSKDLILYVGYVAPHIPKGMPSLFGEKMATYHSAFSFGAEKSVCVSLGDPLLGNNAMAGGNTYFNIYSPSEASQEAFVKVLVGEIPYSTESPVDVEMKRRIIYG
jgi:beta-N-acetylhexosaminidase